MKLNPDFQIQKIAGMWMLFPTNEMTRTYNAMLKLNAVGAFLWQGLSEGKTIEQLADMLVEEYGVNRPRAVADIGVFVEKLRQNGCIED